MTAFDIRSSHNIVALSGSHWESTGCVSLHVSAWLLVIDACAWLLPSPDED